MSEHESVWSDLQGVAFSQGYLDAGGSVRTRYLHAGDTSKPALVLLHGSGGHAEASRPQPRGHAETSPFGAIDSATATPISLVARGGQPLRLRTLIAFFDAIGAERVHGESLGGWVASRTADRIERLVPNTAGNWRRPTR